MEKIVTSLLVLGFLFSYSVHAANDPGIQGNQRTAIKQAMDTHIKSNLVKKRYVMFDAQNGVLKKLRFKALHDGIVKKGDYFVSCADFIDSTGKLYDVDFLVMQKQTGQYQVMQALVHAVDGKKRSYHVEG